jgi:hypothetical protein
MPDRKRIHKAALERQSSVVLTDNKTYTLQYATRKSIAWGEHEVVFVAPESGSTPCGWFRIKSLLAGEV